MTSQVILRTTVVVALATSVPTLIACSGRGVSESSKENSQPLEHVAECEQYETALDRCYHRNTAFASQSSVIPKSSDDRRRIRQMCSEALQKLNTVCGSTYPFGEYPMHGPRLEGRW